MRVTAAAALLLLGALQGAHGAANATFVLVPDVWPPWHRQEDARFFCAELGGTLATIHSAAENELARQACGASGGSCWLGLNYSTSQNSWLWQDPPAGQAAAPAYTNWAAGQPNINANAAMTATGEWVATESVDLDSLLFPLCRVAGELNFTLDHNAAQCMERCWPDEGQNNDAPHCCALPGKMSCADDSLGGTYQLVRTASGYFWDDDWEDPDRQEYDFKCYPCKPGKTCDNGKGDDKKECPDPYCDDGCVAIIIIFYIILPLCCICCSVAACCYAVQQNNRQPAARIQQQPVAYAAARPAGGAYAPGQPVYGGAVQMQQYGKQPYVAQPTVVQPTVVQPTVVRPTVVQAAVVQGAVVQGTVVQGEIQREY